MAAGIGTGPDYLHGLPSAPMPIPRADPVWTSAERWLAEREPLGMHFGLDRMLELMSELGDPQDRFRSIHVVGTNGKSSTVRMTAAILERHGIRTGAYLSPHLHSFSERIEVGERALAPADLAACIERVAAAVRRVEADRAPEDRVTQFEALTAAAFVELGRHPVDVAVIEAGLGGRLDATNVIGSEVQALTNVGLEHTHLLGATHAEIAAEKLDVVRPGATLVLGPELPAEVEQLAAGVASARGARLVRAPRPSGAASSFQDRNFAVAERCARALLGTLDPAATRAAAAVRTPGRLEVVSRAPLTVLDAAHNPHGVRALAEALPGVLAQGGVDADAPLVCVVSVLADKDADAMLRVLAPVCTAVIATGNSSDRARDPYDLAARARAVVSRPVVVEPDPLRALQTARALSGAEGVVVATGSIVLVGDLHAGSPRPVRR